MTDEEIKEKLLASIARTEQSVADYKEMAKPVAPDNAIGRVSRMDAINNKSVAEAVLRQAEEKLRSLKKVLSQVGTKEFGLCIKCHKPIPAGRIIVRPESLLCIDCAK
jgi:DnaK suppressor protein